MHKKQQQQQEQVARSEALQAGSALYVAPARPSGSDANSANDINAAFISTITILPSHYTIPPPSQCQSAALY